MADEKQPHNFWSAALAWASGQPFNNVVTAGLLCAVAWYGYYDISVGKPQTRQEFREIVKEIESNHDKIIDRLTQSWEREREQDRQHMDRLMNALRGEIWQQKIRDPKNLAVN